MATPQYHSTIREDDHSRQGQTVLPVECHSLHRFEASFHSLLTMTGVWSVRFEASILQENHLSMGDPNQVGLPLIPQPPGPTRSAGGHTTALPTGPAQPPFQFIPSDHLAKSCNRRLPLIRAWSSGSTTRSTRNSPSCLTESTAPSSLSKVRPPTRVGNTADPRIRNACLAFACKPASGPASSRSGYSPSSSGRLLAGSLAMPCIGYSASERHGRSTTECSSGQEFAQGASKPIPPRHSTSSAANERDCYCTSRRRGAFSPLPAVALTNLCGLGNGKRPAFLQHWGFYLRPWSSGAPLKPTPTGPPMSPQHCATTQLVNHLPGRDVGISKLPIDHCCERLRISANWICHITGRHGGHAREQPQLPKVGPPPE